MHAFTQAFQQQFNQQLLSLLTASNFSCANKIILGYSGGVDSEVLASLLAEFAKQYPDSQYLLVYVHHGLSAYAEDWAQHCQQRSQRYQLPFHCARVTVKQGARLSLEAQAREARYQAFNELMQAGDILLTAHHQDDQLETLLLALKRGQGPKGLAAMGERQAFYQDKTLLRPLLGRSKADILQFAQLKQLTHIEDESNTDLRFDRNFLRHAIVPQLQSRWPQFAQTASRSAALCYDEHQALMEVVTERLQKAVTEQPWGKTLDCQTLRSYSSRWQALLLRAFIEHQGFAMPSQVQLSQALEQLLTAKVDANVCLQFGALELRRYAGQIYAMAAQTRVTELSAQHIEREQQLDIQRLRNENYQQTQQVLAVQLQLSLMHHKHHLSSPCLRLPRTGEVWQICTIAEHGAQFNLKGSMRCQPHFRHQRRELKKCWQEAGVPPWWREHWPLLLIDGKLAAVLGLWIEQPFLAPAQTQGLIVKVNLSHA